MCNRDDGINMRADDSSKAQQIKNSLYRFLAFRNHSSVELSRKLTAQGFEQEAIASLIAEFTALGLIDDGKFTLDYIAIKSSRGYGPLKIKQELLSRGIEQDLIAAKLNIADNDFWYEIGNKVWQKKFKCHKPQSSAEKMRQLRFLQSRGFTYEQINYIINCYE